MIDLIVGIESTFAMACHLDRVRRIIMAILYPILTMTPNAIRMSLLQFRSRSDLWVTNTYTYTQNINTFQQWLNSIQTVGGSEDECEAIGDALQEVLNIFQHLNQNNGQINEKLAVFITDGAPNGLFTLLDDIPNSRFVQLNGADPWLVANEFNQQGITLVVVGVEPNVIPCDDFYCALAHRTGGHYIPLINAENILSSVIQSVILEGYTFQQAFLRINMVDIEQNSSFDYSAVQQRVNGMLTECQIMTDIQQRFYNRYSS